MTMTTSVQVTSSVHVKNCHPVWREKKPRIHTYTQLPRLKGEALHVGGDGEVRVLDGVLDRFHRIGGFHP